MSTFLTVKEAANLTGKSTSSIRRVLYPIIEKDGHPDRIHIEPTVEDVLKLRMAGENFAWKLSEELVHREFPDEPGSEKGSGASSSRPTSDAEGDLLAMLRGELEIKNKQITTQSELLAKHVELVSGLSERLREGNLLIASLQQRLALTDGRENKASEPVDATRAPTPKPEKGSSATTKTSKPKKGFFSRLFS